MRYMKAKEFDKKFDEKEDITAHLDLSKAIRPGREKEKVDAAAKKKNFELKKEYDFSKGIRGKFNRAKKIT